MTNPIHELNIAQTKQIRLGDAYQYEVDALIITFDAATTEQVEGL